MNHKRIRVSGKEIFKNSVIGSNFPNVDKNEELKIYLDEVSRFIDAKARLRHSGCSSIDMAWVSCGRYDGFFARETEMCNLNAAILIVSEAGGIMSNFRLDENYRNFYNICSGNPVIYNEMIKLILKTF